MKSTTTWRTQDARARCARAYVVSLVLCALVLLHAGTALAYHGLFAFFDAAMVSQREHYVVHVAAEAGTVNAVQRAALHANAPRDPRVLDGAAEAAGREEFDQARAMAERVLEIDQTAPVRVRAHDIAGYSAMRTDSQAAIEHFNAAIATSAELGSDDADADSQLRAPWRALWLARLAFAAGDFETAHAQASAAEDGLDGRLAWHEARWLSARAAVNTDEAGSHRTLSRLLETYPEYPRRDAAIVELAAHLYRAGHVSEAATSLDELCWERPWTAAAQRAETLFESSAELHESRRNRTAEERLERAGDLRSRRHWAVARAALMSLYNDTADGDASLRNRIRFQLAVNAYEADNYEEARNWLDTIAGADDTGLDARALALWRARTLSRLDQESDALALLVAYYDAYPSSEADRVIGEFAWDFGLYDEAAARMGNIGTERGWTSRFNRAFIHFLLGDWAAAEAAFEALAASGNAHTRGKCRYWQARAMQEAGRDADAAALFQRVADERQRDWYGLLSTSRLAEMNEAGAPANHRSADAAPAINDRPGRIHWSGVHDPRILDFEYLDAMPEHSFRPYHPEAQSEVGLHEFAERWRHVFPDADLAVALFDVGAVESARVVFREIAAEYGLIVEATAAGARPSGRRPITLDSHRWEHWIDNRREARGYYGIELSEDRFPIPTDRRARRAHGERQETIYRRADEIRPDLVGALQELNDHYIVRRMMVRSAGLSGTGDISAERSDWLAAYPRAYGWTTRRYAARYNLNPFLMWSLIIVESDMNPDSVSVADAYGLMQVIPKTGELVALDTGVEDFGIHDLIDPEPAIEYGSWYLAQLVEKFHGQEALAMVAYNAGPHQVARWLDWRGDGMPLDAFIETVPFEGASDYPKKILRHLAAYQELYFGERALYIGNRLDATYERNIHY